MTMKTSLISVFGWPSKRSFIVAAISFALGILFCVAWQSVVDKAALMEGRGAVERVKNLATVSKQVGFTQLISCRSKVDRLHRELARTNTGEFNDEAVELIASILLDGRDCNLPLLSHIESKQPLPRLIFFTEFRLVRPANREISSVLQDEQDLVLWMLARINPEKLVPSPDHYQYLVSESRDELRSRLVAEWEDSLAVSVPSPSNK